jgi:CRP/FNR family transcriptional regulator
MNKKLDVVDILRVIPSYAGLDEAILETLANVAVKHNLNSKQVVFLEGESCAGYYIVQEGWLKAVKISVSGREQIIRFIGPGNTFNEESVINGTKNHVTVETLEPSKLWVIQRESLLRILDECPAFSRILTEALANRVIHLTNMIENLALLTVEARQARIFLEHSSSEIMKRRRWSTQAEMAARLGTVPDVLNRALRSLAEENLIKIQRHEIQILDRKGLEKRPCKVISP